MKRKKKEKELPASSFNIRETEGSFSVSPRPATLKPESRWQHFKNHFFDTGSYDHLSGYEIFFIFVVSAILGALVEQLFCVITNGYWERRTSLVYGEFGFAYSIGATLFTLLLFKDKEKEWWRVFFKTAIICSIAEYIMSWGEELLFGAVSWDYHGMPLNINGRICFLYGLFWGALGLLWSKLVYPVIKDGIKHVNKKVGKILFWIFFVFLIYDTIISVCAVTAFSARQDGNPVDTPYEKLMEAQFPDEFMIWTYPNSMKVEDDGRVSKTLNADNHNDKDSKLEQFAQKFTEKEEAPAPVSCIRLAFGASVNT